MKQTIMLCSHYRHNLVHTSVILQKLTNSAAEAVHVPRIYPRIGDVTRYIFAAVADSFS